MTTVDHGADGTGRHSAPDATPPAGTPAEQLPREQPADQLAAQPGTDGPVPPPRGADTGPDRPGGPNDRRLLIFGAVLIGCVLLLALFIVGIRALDRSVGHHDGDGSGDRHRVTGTLGDRDEATLALVSGVTTVTVRSGDLHGDDYRVSTPDDGAMLPAVVRQDDRVEVQLTDSGEHGASTVLIELSDDVAWHIRLGGGSSEAHLDLTEGGLASLDFVNGISSIEASLPKPHGTVPVRLSGGASNWTLHLPNGVPARLAVTGGAGSATVDGVAHGGISQQTFTTDSYDSAGDRYDLQALSGVSTILVDHR